MDAVAITPARLAAVVLEDSALNLVLVSNRRQPRIAWIIQRPWISWVMSFRKTVWLTDDEYNRQQQAIALANQYQGNYSIDNPNPSSDMEQIRSNYYNDYLDARSGTTHRPKQPHFLTTDRGMVVAVAGVVAGVVDGAETVILTTVTCDFLIGLRT